MQGKVFSTMDKTKSFAAGFLSYLVSFVLLLYLSPGMPGLVAGLLLVPILFTIYFWKYPENLFSRNSVNLGMAAWVVLVFILSLNIFSCIGCSHTLQSNPKETIRTDLLDLQTVGYGLKPFKALTFLQEEYIYKTELTSNLPIPYSLTLLSCQSPNDRVCGDGGISR
jgi:hypothetical protein